MNNLDFQYQNLLRDILDNGVEKETRNGKTLSIFGYQIRHRMSEGFPLLTTKKMAVKAMVTELRWFLTGGTNIKYLVDNDCFIWVGDAIKSYEKHNGEIDWGPFISKEEVFIEKIKTDDEFAKQWGELGKVYGHQWRNWRGGYSSLFGNTGLDQISELIKQLKENPNSRRLLVTAWDPSDVGDMVLPPCHYSFQCYVREGKYLSLIWNQRSVDTFLGLPFNIASYGLLLILLAEEVGMIPDELIGNLGDTHLYLNHIDQAIEQLKRDHYVLPKIKVSNVDILNGKFDYELIDYQSHPAIKAPLSN